jgi:hypothetical protein
MPQKTSTLSERGPITRNLFAFSEVKPIPSANVARGTHFTLFMGVVSSSIPVHLLQGETPSSGMKKNVKRSRG